MENSPFLGKLVVVCGGYASEAAWSRTRTMVYHKDVTNMDCNGAVQWQAQAVQGDRLNMVRSHMQMPKAQDVRGCKSCKARIPPFRIFDYTRTHLQVEV